jgi:DNA-binding NarL/FixJ family response regulator
MSTAERRRRVSGLVADDHPLFRGALMDMLKRRPDLELAAEAGTIADAIVAAAAGRVQKVSSAPP